MKQIEQLYCQSIVPVYRKQMKLLDQIGQGEWNFEKETSTLSFSSGASWKTQILGLETESGIWMWAWADTGNLPGESTISAGQIRDYGTANSIEELTVPKQSTEELGCAGHTLAVVASSLYAEAPYFVCPFGVTSLFTLVTDPAYDGAIEDPGAEELEHVIRQLVADYAVPDHRYMLICALSHYGFNVEKGATTVKGRKDDSELVATFDESNDLSELTAKKFY